MGHEKSSVGKYTDGLGTGHTHILSAHKPRASQAKRTTGGAHRRWQGKQNSIITAHMAIVNNVR